MLLDKHGFIYNDKFDGQYVKCETVSLDVIERIMTIQTVGDLLLDPNSEFIMVIYFDNKLFMLGEVFVNMTSSLYNNIPGNDIKLAMINTYDILFNDCKEHLSYTDLPNEIKLRMERIKLLES